MGAPRKYPEELRERAIRLTVDARKDPARRPSACVRICEQLGIDAETLRGWVTQAEVAAGRPGTSTSQAEKIAQLERGNRELRRAKRVHRVHQPAQSRPQLGDAGACRAVTENLAPCRAAVARTSRL